MRPSPSSHRFPSPKSATGGRRLLAVGILATGVVLAGCGGDGDDADASNPVGADAGGDGGDGAAASGDTPSGGAALVVEVDGRSYAFEAMACSTTESGTLVGSGATPGDAPVAGAMLDSGAILDFRIQPEGSRNEEGMSFDEQHYITIDDVDNDLTWNAGSTPFLGGVTFEDSHIEEWTLDGTVASGSASFIEEGVDYGQDVVIEPKTGTFEFQC